MTESEPEPGPDRIPLAPAAGLPAESPPAAKVWNRDFLLLWQGQMVSALGDTVYEIALGFWVLAKTGSLGHFGADVTLAVAGWPEEEGRLKVDVHLVGPFGEVAHSQVFGRGREMAMTRGGTMALFTLYRYLRENG